MRTASLVTHVAAAAIVTVTMALIYATVQQGYRTGANDPQVQMIRDLSERIKQSKSLETLLPTDTVNLQKSLAVFIQFYNEQKQVVYSSGLISNKMPQIPHGVLEAAKNTGENAVTWQPQYNVRLATVTRYVGTPQVAFVLAGRSLQEVEVRVGNLIHMIIICWIIALGIIALHLVIKIYTERLSNRRA